MVSDISITLLHTVKIEVAAGGQSKSPKTATESLPASLVCFGLLKMSAAIQNAISALESQLSALKKLLNAAAAAEGKVTVKRVLSPEQKAAMLAGREAASKMTPEQLAAHRAEKKEKAKIAAKEKAKAKKIAASSSVSDGNESSGSSHGHRGPKRLDEMDAEERAAHDAKVKERAAKKAARTPEEVKADDEAKEAKKAKKAALVAKKEAAAATAKKEAAASGAATDKKAKAE